MCWAGDGDSFEWYTEREPLARKRHRCGECGRPILPGERYLYVFARFEGEPTSHKVCLDCRDGVCSWLSNWCGGYLFEGTFEDCAEHMEEPYAHGLVEEEDIADLAQRMACKWTPAMAV